MADKTVLTTQDMQFIVNHTQHALQVWKREEPAEGSGWRYGAILARHDLPDLIHTAVIAAQEKIPAYMAAAAAQKDAFGISDLVTDKDKGKGIVLTFFQARAIAEEDMHKGIVNALKKYGEPIVNTSSPDSTGKEDLSTAIGMAMEKLVDAKYGTRHVTAKSIPGISEKEVEWLQSETMVRVAKERAEQRAAYKHNNAAEIEQANRKLETAMRFQLPSEKPPLSYVQERMLIDRFMDDLGNPEQKIHAALQEAAPALKHFKDKLLASDMAVISHNGSLDSPEHKKEKERLLADLDASLVTAFQHQGQRTAKYADGSGNEDIRNAISQAQKQVRDQEEAAVSHLHKPSATPSQGSKTVTGKTPQRP
jgi:hypothetical protein